LCLRCPCRYKAKRKAFSKYVKKYTDGKKEIEKELEQLKKHCTVIRLLAHTQVGDTTGDGDDGRCNS
jgi:hypothetical protein